MTRSRLLSYALLAVCCGRLAAAPAVKGQTKT